MPAAAARPARQSGAPQRQGIVHLMTRTPQRTSAASKPGAAARGRCPRTASRSASNAVLATRTTTNSNTVPAKGMK